MNRVTAELNEAHRLGNMREVFRLVRVLGVKHEITRLRPAQDGVADPVREREAWKEHFRLIQEGRELAEDEVWDNVGVREEVEVWMGEDPTDEEIQRCGRQMRNGKAAGVDGFLAEFYKYGTRDLQSRIHSCVREMWRKAREAVAGQEAEAWPSSWTKAIVVPLWKRKGDKRLKSTRRGITVHGITLLSVGSKLLARVVALRIQRWSET